MKLFVLIYIVIFTCFILLVKYVAIYDDSFEELYITDYINLSISTLITDIIIYGIYKIIYGIYKLYKDL